MLRLVVALLVSSFALGGCNKIQATAEQKPAKPKKAAAKAPLEKAEAKPKAEEHAVHDPSQKFVVPFAWEASRDEPLSQARAYLKEILADNQVYMEHGPKFFAAFAEGQKPRATVVACADSRVHTTAFDATPENDDFMVRNIGNQVENSLGSIEYGVEHLQTPVLLIIGHSGCGAVKAAMGDISTQAEPVRKELERLRIPKAKSGISADAAWSDGVVANVHAQVLTALGKFGNRVQEGKLTVVGAVYDFRNDLGKGSGKLTIVDVNGNGEVERMSAFVDAIENEVPGRKKADAKARKGEAKKGEGHGGLDAEVPEISVALKQAVARARELQGGEKPKTAAASEKPAAKPASH